MDYETGKTYADMRTEAGEMLSELDQMEYAEEDIFLTVMHLGCLAVRDEYKNKRS